MTQFTKAPLTSGARHTFDLNGVRIYLMHRAGRNGGHFASISATGGMAEVIAFPEGAAFGTQAKLRDALIGASTRGNSVVVIPGLGAALR